MSQEPEDLPPPTVIEAQLRSQLFAHRFALGFILSQFAFRDALATGKSGVEAVGDLQTALPGLLAEARYPPEAKRLMMQELRDIADQVMENARTFDGLGRPRT